MKPCDLKLAEGGIPKPVRFLKRGEKAGVPQQSLVLAPCIQIEVHQSNQ